MRKFGFLALILVHLAMAAEARADFGVLGVANGYGEFVLGDSNRSFVDAQGKVAVGGNAYFNGFTVASQQPTGSTVNLVVGETLQAHSATVNGSIIAGGDATYTNPTVNGNFNSNGSLTLGSYGTVNGNVRHATGFNPSTTTLHGTTSVGTTPLPFDFASESAYLLALSAAQYDDSDPTGTFQYSSLTFNGGAGGNFFQTTGTQLAAATGGININAPAGATVVINVLGSGFAIPNTGFGLSGGITVDHVLFNFVDATSLTVSSAVGSFLAPRAAITTSFGSFDGNLIAGSLSGSIETHVTRNGSSTLFSGTLRPVLVPVPEPSSLAMIGLGGLGLGLAVAGRRRRRAS